MGREQQIMAQGPGRFFLVVGPSGVGKDTLIDAACQAHPTLERVRRSVTRAVGAGGEEIDAVNMAEFERREAAGEFVLSWRAHGLAYGIPDAARMRVAGGCDVIANGSRSVLDLARARLPGLAILSVTARPQTLARRLAARGRESEAEIAARLAHEAPPPSGPDVIAIDNDGPLADTIAAVARAVQPLNA